MAEELTNPFPQKELPVLITVDVCDGSFDQGERKPRFRDLMETLPLIRSVLREVVGARSSGLLPVTWFVRADMQVREITGNAMGLFQGWRDMWDDVHASGGETAWHPHLYKRRGNKWVPIRDPKKLKSAAERTWHELSGEEWKPVTVRMGESVGSNELMRFLDTIGIVADASALPGRQRDDGLRWFDWAGTPDAPYNPSKGDYRRPSEAMGSGDRVKSEESLNILEIPFTMAGIRAPYDRSEAVRRYVDLSFDPKLLGKAMKDGLRKYEYLLCVVHPLQAVGREVPEGGLVVGGLDVVRKNLEMILGSVRSVNRSLSLMTIKDFAAAWLGKVSAEVDQPTVASASSGRKGQRDTRVKGGIQRTTIESGKSARLTTKGGVRAENRPPRRGPRKRRG